MVFASALVMLSALTLRTTGETVIQPPGPLLIKEAAPLFINCTYQSTGYPTLFWYVQRSRGRALELLLKEGPEEQRGDGFSARNNRAAKSFHLQKRASDASDSATYFCALSDTVGETPGRAA
ncbi:UNVERIFIED_CONTAM: hypothetical protein K2H54_044864 [Gekko kuhli]